MCLLQVEIVKHNTTDHSEVVSNTMNFSFTCPDVPLRKIVPSTYAEGMTYLDGQRRYRAGKQHAEKLGSTLLRFY